VEQLITSMTKMIEPVMMVCVGAIVLVTVIALYLPVSRLRRLIFVSACQ